MPPLELASLVLDYLKAQGAIRTRVGEKAISCSSSGSCSRQVSYMRWFPEKAEPVDAPAMARFELGHAVHAALAGMLGKTSLDVVGVEEPVSMTIAGHPDRLIPGNVDLVIEEEGKRVPVEIKSCGAWEWKVVAALKAPSDPQEGNISWSHRAQNLAYQKALGSPRGYMLYWCVEKDKEAAKHPLFPFFSVEVPWSDQDWARVERHWRAVLDSTKDALPERPYVPVQEKVKFKPSGRWVLPFPCNYCAFLGDCWPQAQRDPEGLQARTFVVPEPERKSAAAATSGIPF